MKRIFFFSSLIFFPQASLAQDPPELGQLTGMSLEDLMQVKVSVASKQELTRSDSPGFVTVYTEAEIKALGYYTLAELANITPGYTSMYKFIGKQSYTVRGQRVTGDNFDNNKVLVLVDGIPMNHLRNGRAPINEELMLDGVEKVEFLKGPASALYGTGAFFGVINVVMKKRKEIGTVVEGRSTFGSYGAQQNNVSTFFKNEQMEGKAVATYSQKNSMGLPWGDGSTDRRRSIDHVTALSLVSSLTFNEGALKGLTPGYILNNNRSGTWDNGNDLAPTTEVDTGYYLFKTSTAFLKYKKKLSKEFSINSFVRKGWSTEESRSYGYRQNFSGIEALAEGQYKFDKDSRLVFGLNYDQRQREGRNNGTYQNTPDTQQNDYVNSPSNPLRTYSAYVQHNTEFAYLKGLLVTAGLRFDRATAEEGEVAIDVSQFSPRLAFVQKLNDKFSLKFLYGRALRSPDLKMIGVANEFTHSGTLNNPKLPGGFNILNAEKISSYEIGAAYDEANLSTTLATFYTVVTDQIGREPVDLIPNDPTNGKGSLYRNKKGDSIAYGLEYELRYAFKNKSFLNANAAWNMANLPDNSLDQKRQFGGVPSYTASVAYIKNWERFSSSVVGYYMGARRTNLNSQNPQGAFFLLDANVGYKINTNVDITLWLRNLGNRDFRYSDRDVTQGFAERGYARSIFGSLSYRF